MTTLGDDPEFPDDDDEAALEGGDVDVQCPYCGEFVLIEVDPFGGTRQEYVQDCEICCRPWQVIVETDADGGVAVEVRPADDPDGGD